MRKPKDKGKTGRVGLPDSVLTTEVSRGNFTGQAVQMFRTGTAPLLASPPRRLRKMLQRSRGTIVFVIRIFLGPTMVLLTLPKWW